MDADSAHDGHVAAGGLQRALWGTLAGVLLGLVARLVTVDRR